MTNHVEDELEKNELMPKSQDAQPTIAKPLPIVIPPPFPSRFAKSKKEEQEKDILETFRKVEVNIHLLDAIKQISQYAKFLKELCTSKRKLKGDERVHMRRMFQQFSKRNYLLSARIQVCLLSLVKLVVLELKRLC